MAKYRIMTFDGGGIRGALTATLLKRLQEQFPDLIAMADLFAGTSTGSFIALGLASGKTPEDLVELYSEANGKFIFTPRHINLLRPKYDNIHLMRLLSSVFPPSLRLKDLKTKVLIPSFKVNDPVTGNWTPVFFSNFANSTTGDEDVIDAALSSSAAPTYFPSYQQHIDGGVIANNPSLAAIAAAVDEKAGQQSLDEIILLSIGTGFNAVQITADTSQWGILQWAVDPSPPPELPLQEILFDGTIEVDSIFSFQLLNNRFFRLNPVLTENVALDDYKEIPTLVQVAQEYDLGPAIDWINQYWL